jgi:L-asparaginase II
MERVADDALLCTATRSGSVESWHRGSVVVVEDGRVVRAFGDPEQRVWCRSATKPFQALPLLERGVARRLGLDAAEVALLTASHNGAAMHVEGVQGILKKGGFVEDDLQCGPHAPFDVEAARALARSGGRPGRVHNNCSGKHAGFLCLAADMGVGKERYLEPEAASQRLVRATVGEVAGVEPERIEVGLDGCGAPTFRLPLLALAHAFARLTNPEGLGAVREAACGELLAAIHRSPELLAGEGRLCTALVRSAPGAIFPKNGAEGVYAVGLAGRGIGLAVKVSDGNERGYLPVVVQALQWLGLWQEVPAALIDFAAVPLRNTQKKVVGHVQSVLRW